MILKCGICGQVYAYSGYTVVVVSGVDIMLKKIKGHVSIIACQYCAEEIGGPVADLDVLFAISERKRDLATTDPVEFVRLYGEGMTKPIEKKDGFKVNHYGGPEPL